MIIRERETRSIQILELYGQLTDGGNVRALRQAIRELLDKGCTLIVVNLRGLDKIDSAGLGELVACNWRVQKTGGTLHLITRDRDMVFEILMKVRLNQIFSILDDESELAGED
jgi:anti-anti-sigma factor